MPLVRICNYIDLKSVLKSRFFNHELCRQKNCLVLIIRLYSNIFLNYFIYYLKIREVCMESLHSFFVIGESRTNADNAITKILQLVLYGL